MKPVGQYDFVAIITHRYDAFVMQTKYYDNPSASKEIVTLNLEQAASNLKSLQDQLEQRIPDRLFFDVIDGYLDEVQLEQITETGYTRCRNYQLQNHPDFPNVLKQ